MGDQIPGQIEILDYLKEFENQEKPNYKITKPIRLISLFSGIGAQIAALNRLDYPVEDYKTSEWDINAVKMYNAMHCKDFTDYSENLTVDELVDWLDAKGCSLDGKEPLPKDKIKRKGEKWLRETYNNYIATKNIGSIVSAKGEDLEVKDTDRYEYVLFYSFPCQDLSVAGKQKGMSKDANTRSGLLWHVERLLKECETKPQILIMENVSQVHGKKFLDDWNSWLEALDNLGYKTFWADLNAKDYGIAQNRLRTFAISILDNNSKYEFPEPVELKTCMKDYLEDEVDEKYYINNEKAKKLIQSLIDRKELP